ncbi:MAG: pantoate--beta-alanine ligase [Planctomycetes bacterium]|jgi:pantoate--beta-alanine ligase|nr:pantoate--beta-alanine ligase [Planctomycetota bacterium]MBL6909221.1 pantoate--beta-alanine ligase [Pirellulales bacterium]HAU49794.1 pantoate--beta-alanine ligase [Planctomycetaceae bacterium]HBK73151.1 pantoate--beta-alanine ligase [Planctomycetaceae bacterium]|tara:strand:+ start:3129 stop:3989 length:861 start_codon:yes stop_codon:yes gene_type:complete
MSTPLVIRDRNTMRNLILTNQTMGRRIGFVPTMGSLHAGHTSLVDRAMAECDDVVTSIFVNPSQFGPQEDFERYPRDFDADFNLLAQHDVRWIFAPDVHEMYPPGDSTRIEISGPAEPYEGQLRPGHFSGVATIVFRLLQSTPANTVYFGAKDWQQVLVVRQMVRDLGLDVEVMTCPIVRDKDGLALSSRNAYLSESERTRAQTIYAALQQAEENWCRGLAIDKIELKVRDMLSAREIRIDYADIVHDESLRKISEVSRNTPAIFLIACHVGSTRLIDNILLPSQT